MVHVLKLDKKLNCDIDNPLAQVRAQLPLWSKKTLFLTPYPPGDCGVVSLL